MNGRDSLLKLPKTLITQALGGQAESVVVEKYCRDRLDSSELAT